MGFFSKLEPKDMLRIIAKRGDYMNIRFITKLMEGPPM